jgi:hypothetical protein
MPGRVDDGQNLEEVKDRAQISMVGQLEHSLIMIGY